MSENNQHSRLYQEAQALDRKLQETTHRDAYLSETDQYKQTRLYGIYRGYVVDVNDPMLAGRVKVFIPALMHDESQAVWCDPLYITEGQHLSPFLNQLVFVLFENGNPNLPVYIGTRYHRNDALEELIPTDKIVQGDKGEFLWTTDRDYARWTASDYTLIRTPRSKSRIHIQDSPDFQYMELYTGNKQWLVLHDVEKFVQLSTTENRNLTLSDEYKFISLNTPAGQTILLDDNTNAIIARTSSGRGISIDDSSSKIMFGSAGSSSLTTYQLISTQDRNPKAVQSVYESISKSFNQNYQTASNTFNPTSPRIIIDEQANQIILQAGSASIIIDGNSGTVKISQHLNVG